MAPRSAVRILLCVLALEACQGSSDLDKSGAGAGGTVGTDTGAGGTVGAEAGVAGADAVDGGSVGWPAGKYISIDEVYARSQAADPEMLLVNVVDPEYYNLGHIANSLKIPWDALAGRLGEVDPGRHVVLYCRRGVRSESAYTTLMDNGYPMVWVMEGGIEKWIAAGYPTVAD
jgi:rhodanese-related sulfurtransferase